MINYYVDEFGTLRIYKGTQCLAYISHCENSTTQEIRNLVSEVIIESGYSQYLGDFVKYNDEIFFVTDDDSHFKVDGTETKLLLLPKEYSDANKNEEWMRLGNPDNVGFWVYESLVKPVDNTLAKPVDNEKKQIINNTNYQNYQLQWMQDHAYSLEDLIMSLEKYRQNTFGLTIPELFEEWEVDQGFDGELWACEDEFEDCEMQNDDVFKYCNRCKELFFKKKGSKDE